MIKKIVPSLCLVLIIVLAVFLRAWKINENPPELFSDELVIFVSAKNIIENGHDLEGRLMPYFSDRLELRPPIYGYSSYFSSRIFGENALGIRAPAIFFGLVSVILVYLLTLELFGDTASALFAAFFMAIIPWHIHYSRIGWESASLLPFLLLSTYLFFYGIKRDRKFFIILSFGFFSLTIYTYQPAALYAFLFLSSLLILNRKYFLRERKVFLAGSMIAVVVLIPFIWTIAREPHLYYKASRIFTFSGGINSESLSTFLKNYLSHFTTEFLFSSGDTNLRHGARTGTIYWVMLPLLIAGLVYLVKLKSRRKELLFILFWLVIFPVAAALTNDGVPHATRSLIGAPVTCILSGLGVGGIFQSIASRTGRKIFGYVIYIVVVILSLVSLAKFSKKYYIEYPKISYAYWEYGHKEVFSRIGKLKGSFKRACMENLNYWNEVQVVEFYARDSNLKFINNTDDFRCSRRGTILVQRSRIKKYRNSRLADSVKGPDKKTAYFIFTIDD